MVKTVVEGREVPHLFAAQSQNNARNSNGSLWFEGKTLYSYREPIAHIHESGIVLISSDHFSVTTSKHQSWALYALRHMDSMELPDLRRLLENRSLESRCDWIANRAKEIESLRDKKQRAEWRINQTRAEIAALEEACAWVWRNMGGKKSNWQTAIGVKAKADKAAKIRMYTQARNQLESGLEIAQRIIDGARAQMVRDAESGRTSHGLQAWWRLDNAVSDIRRIDSMGARYGAKGIAATATFTHAAKLMGKIWAADCMRLAAAIADFADSLQPEIQASRAAYDAAERLSNAEKVAAWYAGENVGWPLTETACRVLGNEVQTSRGARVPLDQALQLVDLAKACRAAGRSMDLKGRRIGPYHGEKIGADGSLTIGCHVILWPAIESALARYEAK